MNREDRKMTREEAQQVLDLLSPGCKLPAPRTEEEFLAGIRSISSETIMNLYTLYKKERN